MSIDKFGRQMVKRGGGVDNMRGPKGDGFHFTSDGSYDIQNKRITNIASAIDPTDAVNLNLLRSKLTTLETDVSNSVHTKISNVETKINNLTKDLTKITHALSIYKTHIGFNQKRLISLSPSKNANDAIVRMELEAVVKDVNKELGSIKGSISSLLQNFDLFKDSTNTALRVLNDSLLSVNSQLLTKSTITP